MYALAPDISAVDTDYGIALLHHARGQYWNLNPSGAIVLRSALESDDLGRAVEALMSEYDVARPTAEKDVGDVVGGLLAAGILVEAGP
ncbi:lasso peptide biosynthesis PqqD family chaperone [Nonomuraea sp. NPDC050643]|uniref:lasso peptide biosynthesis PqqD family chaperone n=1 Tax=Nonomuraea sp. NPDC050643 TaxID=3155660 RepID=UPI0033CB0110